VATAAENRLNILRTTSFAAASDCQKSVGFGAFFRGNCKRTAMADCSRKSTRAPRYQSVNSTAAVSPRIAASEEGLPTVFGGVISHLLINQFAMSRTKASVNPPAAIPKITGADT